MKDILVIGGGGFVGSAIVKGLINKDVIVTVAGRSHYPHIEKLGVTCFKGDIADPTFVDTICRNVDTVFHVAAKAGIWGSWSEYEAANVTGTKNVVQACLKHKVERLVYTSTPSVVFNKENIINGDETLDYSDAFLCNYAKSKAIAEKFVLDHNSGALKTCAIRPHLIWGPHDPHLIPRVVERARQGKLKIVGDGTNKVDITYIDNVAHAHILAAKELAHEARCAGKAYFIGQEEPVVLWQWINELLKDVSVVEISKKVNFRLAYLVGGLLELIYKGLKIESEPQMTRFLA
ncbi:MAG: NAD-dependent epimerase/dehydratase family protein, partial [Desulfobulbaceae bacterium]